MHTRRGFLWHTGAAGLTTWLAAHAGAIAAAAAHAHTQASAATPQLENLSAAQARDIEAIAARIVPSGDDGPGAREAGVVWFIDRALGNLFADSRAELLRALESLPAGFADLDTAMQDRHLRSIEDGPLFGQLRFMTVLGLLSSPDYGGNRDGLGWQLMGFEDTHAYQPPFGYYDSDYPGFALPEAADAQRPS